MKKKVTKKLNFIAIVCPAPGEEWLEFGFNDFESCRDFAIDSLTHGSMVAITMNCKHNKRKVVKSAKRSKAKKTK